jgi:predicted phosphodiesterase
MTVGYISDIHLGVDIDGDTIELLEDVAASFEHRGVDTVVLLGDISTVESIETARSLATEVRDVFERFECYATAGNGDHVQVIDEVFENGPNAVVTADEDTATVLVNSATTSTYHTGEISKDGLELLEDQLAAGKSVTVAAHHPLQHTHHLPPLFETQPEIAFPDNKAQLQSIVADTDGTLEQLVCGHLHPKGRLRVLGNPLEVELDVLEPVLDIEFVYESEVERSLNEHIVVDNLVYDH